MTTTDNIETDNDEFRNAFRLLQDTNSSVYLTGRAGTGKSTFLRYIVEHIRKKTVVLAPTGVAAVNAGGVTIHSFFKVPQRPLPPDGTGFESRARMQEVLRLRKEQIKLINELELIVIDEVSMVRADAEINRRARRSQGHQDQVPGRGPHVRRGHPAHL